MTNFIVIKVCCFDCNKFEKMEIYNMTELGLLMKEIIEKKVNGEEENNYYIYTTIGDFICKI